MATKGESACWQCESPATTALDQGVVHMAASVVKQETLVASLAVVKVAHPGVMPCKWCEWVPG